jgi:hypothetical protein
VVIEEQQTIQNVAVWWTCGTTVPTKWHDAAYFFRVGLNDVSAWRLQLKAERLFHFDEIYALYDYSRCWHFI